MQTVAIENTSETKGFTLNAVTTKDAASWDCRYEEDMLTRCRKGDDRALEALLKRFERPIFALAHKLSGNHEDTNDIAATAFLRICQSIHHCKSAVALPAWVNTIVKNVYYDMCRRTQRNPAVSLDEMIENTGEATASLADGEQKSPWTYVSDNERRSVMDNAISSLPEFQQKLVTLFYHGEHSYEEISQMMGIPVGTVKSRLCRARLTLQRKLQPHYGMLVN